MWFALFDVTVLLVATVGIWVEKKKAKNNKQKRGSSFKAVLFL